jgi:hypothetical protein
MLRNAQFLELIRWRRAWSWNPTTTTMPTTLRHRMLSQATLHNTLMENRVPLHHQPGEGHVKQRIKWPASNAEKQYNQFDNDFDKILETTLIGNVERKIQTYTRLIYAVVKESFGKEKPEPSRRELQKGKLRKELNQLKSCKEMQRRKRS